MSNWLSRIVVAIVGLPVVLGVVYLGGWWVFALVTAGRAIVGLHEYWLLARPLAPLAPAGYIGAVLALVGRRGRRDRLGRRRRADDVRARVPAEGDLRGARGGDDRDQRHGAWARSGSAAGSAS